MFSKKEFGIVSNLRFISMKNFKLSCCWAWKKFYNLGAWKVLLQFCMEDNIFRKNIAFPVHRIFQNWALLTEANSVI